MRFSVVLHTDDGARYGVTVPDLPGCFSTGESLEGAIESAKEAIDLHLEGLLKCGGDIPIMRSAHAYAVNPEYAGGVWAHIDVDIPRL